MASLNEYSGKRSSSQGLQAGESERYSAYEDLVNDEDTGRVERPSEAVAKRVRRLLLGACRIISDNSLEPLMGPDLADWWGRQPEAQANRIRKILNEIPVRDVDTLKEWVRAGNSLDDF